MQKAVVVTGRLIGPKSVELDEPVAGASVDVEVLIRPVVDALGEQAGSLCEFLRSLPSGARSKTEIDEELRAERACWGER